MPRVLIGTKEVAGYYHRLAGGLRDLGVPVTTVGISAHVFHYGTVGARSVAVVARYERSSSLFEKAPRRRIALKLRNLIRFCFDTLALLHWAIPRHDVFIFGFGSSLLFRRLDIPLLKLFGRRTIAMLGHGSETRPAYIDGAQLQVNGTPISGTVSRRRVNSIRRNLAPFLRWADVIVSAPLSAQHLKDLTLNSFALGLPNDTMCHRESPDTVDDDNASHRSLTRILHAPSHPIAKGTAKIRAAIESLKQKGHQIDYVEVSGQPHAVVQAELLRCDFVVDQLYSDTPMAGFAAEAAAHGKPAVVGGYGWESLRGFVNEEAWPPSAICHPDETEATIEQLIIDPAYRLQLGARAREFVTTHWTSRQVAERYLRLIEGNIPRDWWFDPLQVCYVHGAGMPEKLAKESIRRIVQRYGVRALRLAHNPRLERAFLDFAELSPGPRR